MAEIKQKLKVPKTPNFVFVEAAAPGLKQDGFKELPSISIADLSDAVLSELADEWKAELLASAAQLRKNRDSL